MNHFHLLYVDVNCEILAPFLEAEACKFNFEILYCSSIKEGLSTAETYKSILNGILLDVNIDNQTEKKFELMRFVDEQIPYIPVFLLADDKDTDFEATLDGMRAGACDCIIRNNLDIHLLFKNFSYYADQLNETR